MHELSLMADLMRKIESIAHKQGAKKVVGVKVKLGALAHISTDHFREHFTHVADDSIVKGASLDIEVSEDVDDVHAQEILLESIEILEQ